MEDGEDSALDDERAIELSSIAAIFPELVLDPSDPYTATLDLPVNPVKPLRIHFRASGEEHLPNAQLPTPPSSIDGVNGVEKSGTNTSIQADPPLADVQELQHLPPLQLKITLPSTYPAEAAPVVSLTVDPPWLPSTKAQELSKDCTNIWEELGRDQVVYSYIDHLQQRADHAFDLTTADEAGSGGFALSGNLKLALLDYDLKTKQELFDRGTFDCGVCLEPKKGKHCHRLLLCGHVFCTACLRDFYNACITQGDVDNVKCMTPNCGREKAVADNEGGRPRKRRRQDRTLNPSELLQIPIDQDLVQRYVRMKRKKKLEADKDTIYCPRQWCQGAAKSKKYPKPAGEMEDFSSAAEESEAELELKQPPPNKKKKDDEIPMAERLAICEDCNFAFCRVCRKGWHGELAGCKPRRRSSLDAEEKASLEYMQKYSTPCPTCTAPCQKIHGCNHMTCFQCKTHFCYLCSSWLFPHNPYAHFNDPKKNCYMRLWELEAGDGEGAGHAPPVDFDAFEEDDDDTDDEIPVLPEDDSSDDEEPAPDVRRPERAIEILNFARGAAVAQRIVLPERPRPNNEPPPPAPAPPRRGRNRNNRPRGQRQQAPAQARPPVQVQAQARPNNNNQQPRPPVQPAQPVQLVQAALVEVPDFIQAQPAPGQDRNAALQPAPVRAMGLERFLELARQDLEDEWDSDELDEDMDEEDLQAMVRRVRRERRPERRPER